MAETQGSSEDITCKESLSCRLLFCVVQFALFLLLWICKDHTNLMPPSSSSSSPSKVFGLFLFFFFPPYFTLHLCTLADKGSHVAQVDTLIACDLVIPNKLAEIKEHVFVTREYCLGIGLSGTGRCDNETGDWTRCIISKGK